MTGFRDEATFVWFVAEPIGLTKTEIKRSVKQSVQYASDTTRVEDAEPRKLIVWLVDQTHKREMRTERIAPGQILRAVQEVLQQRGWTNFQTELKLEIHRVSRGPNADGQRSATGLTIELFILDSGRGAQSRTGLLGAPKPIRSDNLEA